MRIAKSPFRFFTRLALTLIRNEKARNAWELLDGLRQVPEAVIYQHTHRFLYEHQFLVPEPVNDFAYWADKIAGEKDLAKALSDVNPLKHSTLAQLRAALVQTLETHVRKNPSPPQLPEGKAFLFMSARRFSIPTPHVAANPKELAEALARVSDGSLYLHLFEAKLRLPPGENDLSIWCSAEWGDPLLAEKVRDVNLALKTLGDIRKELIELFASTEGSRA
ncbi:MAG: hypothetical protein IPP68_03700 [Elusimicrobia bacterium]|nr:hypothetical protein [Elusimicrobiota bacterium]